MRRVDQIALLNAVASGVRLRLLDRLDAHRVPHSITELTDIPGGVITRQAVTKHLDVLEAAKLVRSRSRGRERRYTLEMRGLRALAIVNLLNDAAESL